MHRYAPGDIVSRYGTLGARRDPVTQPVLILATNTSEKMNGQALYTCMPVFSPSHRPNSADSLQITQDGASGLWGSLGQICMTGEETFTSGVNAQLDPKELAAVRERLGRLSPSKHFGEVVYSASPSHDGTQGKNNRPYVRIGEIGKNTNKFLCIPISSHPAQSGAGFEITDRQAAGLSRDDGDKSFTRDSWLCAVSGDQSSLPAGKLSEADRKELMASFQHLKQCLVKGEITPTPPVPLPKIHSPETLSVAPSKAWTH